MHRFLQNNRDELIARCKVKVSLRPLHNPSEAQLSQGVPLFLDQLTRTLVAEENGQWSSSLAISGPSGGDSAELSEMGVGAKTHGLDLLNLGFSIDEVVHAYGDVCQAITDLAVERDAPFTVDAFRTLNRCLDNAIADAVTEFSAHRNPLSVARDSAETNEKFDELAHELRGHLSTSILAFEALESGKLSIAGSTGAMLKRSLQSQRTLLGVTPIYRKRSVPDATDTDVFSLVDFIADAAKVASLYASDTGCRLWVPNVDPRLGVRGCRILLAAAVNNLLHNAFKSSTPQSEVTLHGHAADGRVLVEIRDHRSPRDGSTEPLAGALDEDQRAGDDLDLGLSIAAASVRADGGTLSVRIVSGVGSVSTISLPEDR